MSLLDKATILPIQPEDIGHYQKIAVPFIQDALEQTDGEETLKTILAGIANHERQLWLVKSGHEYIAAVVTMVIRHNSGTLIGEITLAAGRDYHLWDHFTDVVREWFKERGCKKIQVIGRAGWIKKLKEKGFSQRYVILRSDIDG
jgi:hypothetical protein